MTATVAPDYIDWHKWIGLPSLYGADPRDVEAACCIKIAKIICEETWGRAPEIDDNWYRMAAQRRWLDLYEEFNMIVTEAEPEGLWSLVPMLTPSSFGVAVVVQDDLLLVTSHRHGVQAVPLSSYQDLSCWKPL